MLNVVQKRIYVHLNYNKNNILRYNTKKDYTSHTEANIIIWMFISINRNTKICFDEYYYNVILFNIFVVYRLFYVDTTYFNNNTFFSTVYDVIDDRDFHKLVELHYFFVIIPGIW